MAVWEDKVCVTFRDLDILKRVFVEDRLVRGGSCFLKHGLICKLFSPPHPLPAAAVCVDGDQPFVLSYASAKCQLTIKCVFEPVGKNGLVVI